MNCCDVCGITGRNDVDEVFCRLCKLKFQAKKALVKDWSEQYHMIQGMIREEEEAINAA